MAQSVPRVRKARLDTGKRDFIWAPAFAGVSGCGDRAGKRIFGPSVPAIPHPRIILRSLSQGEAPRYQAPKRRRGSVERDRVIPLFGRSDPLAGAPLRRRSPGPVERAGRGNGDCPGRNPGALEAPDASSPSRAELLGLCRTGVKRAGVRKLWRPRSRQGGRPPRRSREPAEAERGPRAENPPGTYGESTVPSSGSGPPGPAPPASPPSCGLPHEDDETCHPGQRGEAEAEQPCPSPRTSPAGAKIRGLSAGGAIELGSRLSGFASGRDDGRHPASSQVPSP
jgi:hypothetical protein